MPIPSYTEIIKLLKAGVTIEAQEKIMELREGAMELQEENLTLREQVRQLEGEVRLQKKMKHENALYWMEGDAVPFCPYCKESSEKLVHLFGPHTNPNPKSTHYGCHVCFHDFTAPGEGNFEPTMNMFRRAEATRKP